ncbi:ribonuclease J [Desulfosarcina sp. OttesenSCG-928-A07]|nr:ribonuclease J [Desulfosarcina sp. OttesenSCG-928-G17]MDL2329786.1 ribonuclease J [Desulfosarcina sp. OttesenSCG-928-A07]
MLKLIPLGGLGEIGLNMMAVEYDKTIFVIDAGLMFPEAYMLGVDFVIPDMEYLRQNRHRVSGVVLTHAHEDHIGALPFLLREINVPVFGTPFTLGIVSHKLEEYDLLGTTALHAVRPREHLKIGSFDIEFIRVNHSIVDGVGLAIRTPVGMVIHTGDFKMSHTTMEGMLTDVNRFAQCGEEGVLALLSDSTNVEKEGHTISSAEIGTELARIADGAKGRIIISLFASNIARIQQIINIASDRCRKVVFNGRSIESSVSIARKLGYLKVPDGMEVGIDDLGGYLEDEVILITTGSQGEPMSSLSRIAAGTHKQIRVHPDDTVVLSSKFIPGNEKAIGKIINNLYRQGADVVYEKISRIHVSGHAFREELKMMINLTKPRFFMPVHGEYRHLLLHSRLARDMGIPADHLILAQNGQVVELDENGFQIRENVCAGRVLVDGKGIGDVGRSVLKERRVLSEEGLVVVNMAFDEETGIVVYGPEIVSRGFVFENETGHLLQDAQCVILEIVEDVTPDVPNRVRKIRSRIQSALRQYFFYTIGRRPVILPFLTEI